MDAHTHTHTWRAAACEVMSFTPLSNISAGAVVATRSVVTGIKFLAEDSGVAVFTLAEESALQNFTRQINEPCKIIQEHNNAITSSSDTVWFSEKGRGMIMRN